MKSCNLFFLFFFIFIHNSFPSTGDNNNNNNKPESAPGTIVDRKISFNQPTYFIFGLNDLKLQLSLKSKMTKSTPLYWGFTQAMFWSIYNESRPIKDINHMPEVFYRFLDEKDNSLKTFEMGYMHVSNGKAGIESRSMDRVFLRSNYLSTYNSRNIDFNLMVFSIYSFADTNKDIVDHMGYWDLRIVIFDLIAHDNQSLDLELKLFAGSQITDLNKGGSQVGLIYHLASSSMNPALYLQRFEGFSENLLEYNQRHSEYRLGLLLSY